MRKFLFIGLFLFISNLLNSGIHSELPKTKENIDLIKEQIYKLKEIADDQVKGDLYLHKNNMQDKFTFLNKLKIYNYCDSLGIKDPTWLYGVFKRESRGNPKAVNPISFATGLINWLPSTAIRQGMVKIDGMTFKTTLERNKYVSEEIKKIPTDIQLDYVYEYFKPIGKKHNLNTSSRVYLAVFSPISLHKPNSYVVGGKKSKILLQNRYLDTNNDSIITVAEIKMHVN